MNKLNIQKFVETTPNLGLSKPAITDKYDIDVFNSNMDVLDTTIYDINDRDIFSTSEKRIATWIDGRPIYRKVIAYTMAELDTSASLSTGISNMDFLIRVSGVARMTGNQIFLPLNFYNEGGWDSFHVTAKGATIQIQRGENYKMNQIYFILEYTKTTD